MARELVPPFVFLGMSIGLNIAFVDDPWLYWILLLSITVMFGLAFRRAVRRRIAARPSGCGNGRRGRAAPPRRGVASHDEYGA